MGWGSFTSKARSTVASNLGTAGSLFGPVGGALGSAAGNLLGKKAEQEVEDAQVANENLARGEIERRAKNLTNVREAYGIGTTETAKRMGAKLQGDVRAEGRQAGELVSSQNLEATGANLTAANAAAASTGNALSSSGQQGKAGVMGRYLQGRQQSALAALTARGNAQGTLDRARLGAESSVITGGANLSPMMAANNSIGQIRAAKSGLAMNTAMQIGNNLASSGSASYTGGAGAGGGSTGFGSFM